MKRWICLLVLVGACWATRAAAQDTATDQRIAELSGRIETLLESQESLRKQVGELSRELERVREQQNKPSAPSASLDDLKRLTEFAREIDRKRLEDYDKIRAELIKLGKAVAAQAAAPPPRVATSPKEPERQPERDREVTKDTAQESGYEYEVKPGDSLSMIVKAYREKNIKVTTQDILKANKGLDPNKLKAHQKIFIPAPKT